MKLKLILTIIFVGFLAFFISKTDFSGTLSIISRSNYILLALGLLIFSTVFFIKTFRLKLITEYYGSGIGYKKSLITTVSSVFFASFTPGRIGGEVVRYYLLNRYGIKGAKPFGVIILERLSDLFVVMLLSTLFFMIIIKIDRLLLLSLGVFIMMAIGIIVTLNFHKFKKYVPKKLKKYVDELKIDSKDPRLFVVFLLSLMCWLFDGYAFYLIINSFGGTISSIATIGIYASLVILSVASILPAGIGSVDVSIFFFLNMFGISNEITLAVLLMLRIITFLLPALFMLSILPIIDFNILKLRKKIRVK